MKKIKYLLMLSLIAMLAVGIFVGCTPNGQIDHEKYPYKVSYCANGGDINLKTERYLHLQGNGVRAPEPKENSEIMVQAVRANYKFLGWAKGKVDEAGNPVLRDTPVIATDGGVWMTKDGAVTADLAAKDPDAVRKYYDYDPNVLWDFSADVVDDNVALIAVWGEYNKFIFANVGEDGEWEDLSALIDGSVGTDSELYASRLHDVTVENGTQIMLKNISTAYEEDRPGKTAIRFYLDEELQNEITGNIVVTDNITVIYCTEVEGEYDIVRDFKSFRDAINDNNNIYVDADIDMAGANPEFFNKKYTGIIQGNGHTINNVTTLVKQKRSTNASTVNAYGAFLGELVGAEIYNLTVNLNVAFEINVNPASENPQQGSARDAICYLGAFAKSMTDCTLENVNVTVVYEITRSLINMGTVFDPEQGKPVDVMEPNTYEVEVTVGSWQAVESDGNVVTNSNITVTEKAQETPDEEVPDAE